MKTTFILLLVLLAAAAAFAGGKQEAKAAGPVELEVWHMWPDPTSEPSYNDFNAALDDWEAAHPDIKIAVDSVTNDLYKPKLNTALSADEAPDVFYTFAAAYSEAFVKAGKILALDPWLDQAYLDQILPGSLRFMTYDGKVYGLPMGMHTSWIYAVKSYFDKFGIAYPRKDFAELIDVIKKFRAQGLTPIAMGNKERWPIILFYEALVVRHGGPDAVVKALESDKLVGPEFEKAAVNVKQLADAKAFREDVLGISMFTEPFGEFVAGKNPMMYHGTWLIAGMDAAESKIKGDVEVLRLPGVAGGKGAATDTWGGPFSMWSVWALTKHKDEAVDFAKFINAAQNKYAFMSGNSLSTYKLPPDVKVESQIFQQVTKLLEGSTSLIFGWDLILPQDQAQDYMDNISSLLGGRITPQQFVKTLPGN
jgi:raffinose/stachyose/melibiose transport system substrate-binding protein